MAPLRSPDWSCGAASPNHRRVTDFIGLEKTMSIVFFRADYSDIHVVYFWHLHGLNIAAAILAVGVLKPWRHKVIAGFNDVPVNN